MGKKAKKKDSSKAWSLLSVVSALVGAAVAKRLLDTTWRVATGKNPPANPSDPDVRFGEAVLWAALSGTLIAVAKMLATRRAANYYVKSTGHLPPELQKDDQDASKASPAP